MPRFYSPFFKFSVTLFCLMNRMKSVTYGFRATIYDFLNLCRYLIKAESFCSDIFWPNFYRWLGLPPNNQYCPDYTIFLHPYLLFCDDQLLNSSNERWIWNWFWWKRSLLAQIKSWKLILITGYFLVKSSCVIWPLNKLK